MASPIIEEAKAAGLETLSEAESKNLLAGYGVPVGDFVLTTSADEASAFSGKCGYPVALKGCGAALAHKTEMGLVKLGIRDEAELRSSFEDLAAKLPEDADGVIISPMYDNSREFIAGLSTDPQFGPVVMFGLGGIFTETIKDVIFRVCPIIPADAEEMLDGIKSAVLLGEVRGMPAADRDAMAAILLGISKAVSENPEITEIDINPILIQDRMPVAADALVKIG